MSHPLCVSLYSKRKRQIHRKIAEKLLCTHCRRPLRIITHSKPSLIEGAHENLEVITYYYGCRRKHCKGGPKSALISSKEQAYLKRSTLTVDVKAKICEWRWKDHKTYKEVQQRLRDWFGIGRSLRGIELILKEYEESCALFISEKTKKIILANGRIILSIDGMKPLNGEDGIYGAFDILSNTPLGCSLLPQQSEFCISAFLKTIKKRLTTAGIKVPIVATISDAQVGQRLGLEKTLKSAKICLCHYHFFELILKGARQVDSAVITKIRSALRNFHYLKKFKTLNAQHQTLPWTAPLIRFLELIQSLSNRKQRPQDPCFNAPEYLAKIQELVDLSKKIAIRSTKLTREETTIIGKFSLSFVPLLERFAPVNADIKRIRAQVFQLKEILDAEESADAGEQKLRELSKQWKCIAQFPLLEEI